MCIPLPNETLFTIFTNLQPGTLVQLTTCSYRFRAIAERVLYTNISIHESLPLARPAPHRTLRCCETLHHRAHLTEQVKKLTIRWQTEFGPREPYIASTMPVLQRLNQVLRVLTQLEWLELALGLTGALICPRTVLDGCHFSALQYFAMSGLGRGSLPHKLPPYSPSLDAFLTAAASVQQLGLSDYYDFISIAPDALPALSAFRGTATTAASIIPGRPVHFLCIVGQEQISDLELSCLAQGSVPLRRLDLSCISVTPMLLRGISRYLTGVVFLKVKLALRHTLHHSLSGISILAGLTPVLGAFHELYQLDLSPTPVSNMGEGSSLAEDNLCKTWSRSCTTLRRVIFPSKTEWVQSPNGMWTSRSTLYYSRH